MSGDDALALQKKLHRYLDLEHMLFRTTCKMTADEFDAACNEYDALRADIDLMTRETR